MTRRETTTTTTCEWCHQPFKTPAWGSGEPQRYCNTYHADLARRVARGEYPLTDCPRCNRRDLRIVSPQWSICQTCGYQTDRPDLGPGAITPSNPARSTADIRQAREIAA